MSASAQQRGFRFFFTNFSFKNETSCFFTIFLSQKLHFFTIFLSQKLHVFSRFFSLKSFMFFTIFFLLKSFMFFHDFSLSKTFFMNFVLSIIRLHVFSRSSQERGLYVFHELFSLKNEAHVFSRIVLFQERGFMFFMNFFLSEGCFFLSRNFFGPVNSFYQSY